MCIEFDKDHVLSGPVFLRSKRDAGAMFKHSCPSENTGRQTRRAKNLRTLVNNKNTLFDLSVCTKVPLSVDREERDVSGQRISW